MEDLLAELVLRRMLADWAPDQTITGLLPRKGKSYLQAKARSLNRTALGRPVIVLVDLDNPKLCASTLREEWFPEGLSPLMAFRVAVVEVEAWIMADRVAFADHLQIPITKVPLKPDSVDDPKQEVVNLARKSRSAAIRDDIVPPARSTASVGPGYNSRVAAFVHHTWQPDRATSHSPSLKRAEGAITSWDKRIVSGY